MSTSYPTSSIGARSTGISSANVTMVLSNASRRISSWEIKDSERTPLNEPKHSSILHGRLEEVLVFEMDESGRTQYHHMSVRALYKYVLAAINHHPARPTTETLVTPLQSKDGAPDPTMDQDAGAATAPLTSTTPSYNGDDDHTTHRLGGWLHPRDMRRLVTPFTTSNEPGIMVRRHVMLLNFDPLRALILSDRLLVLVPEGADSILIELEQRVRGGSLEVERSVFGSFAEEDGVTKGCETPTCGAGVSLAKDKAQGHVQPKQNRSWPQTDETAPERCGEVPAKGWTDLPFELQAADSVLSMVCSLLSDSANQLSEEALAYIHKILSTQSGLPDDALVGIRHMKDCVHAMGSRVKGFVQSLHRVLDDDEDLALMNLTRLRTHPHRFLRPARQSLLDEEAEEPALILEAHLQIGLSLQNALHLLQGQMDTASELVDQQLDASRNKLLFINMVLNLLTLCVTMGTFITGAFGMNLEIKLSENPDAFEQVVWGMVGGMFISLILMIYGLVWMGVVPRSIFRS